jgi:transcriptional regulator with XRE-family HTH domain
MRLIEIGRHLRMQRHTRGLTQQDRAARAGVTRSTVSRIESGTDNDIGFKKLVALLEAVGSTLHPVPQDCGAPDSPIASAARAAGNPELGLLYPDELVQAVLTGQPAPHKAALVRIAVEEFTADARQALLTEVGRLIGDPGRAAAGLALLETNLDAVRGA